MDKKVLRERIRKKQQQMRRRKMMRLGACHCSHSRSYICYKGNSDPRCQQNRWKEC